MDSEPGMTRPRAADRAAEAIPETLGIIAGNGAYPLLLAESARRQGVRRLVAVAFRHETDSALARRVDAIHWIRLGRLGDMLDALRAAGVRQAVMAGQITPTHLFRVRVDAHLLRLLARLPARNAHTIFGAIAEELAGIGVELLPAWRFMESHRPAEGLLTRRAPTPVEATDIELGLRVARATSGLEIGQTVVIKEGTVLAVEAFEGTDAAILRGARLGSGGVVVVKLARRNHDMRFDIPVIGSRTLKTLRKARATALALEAGRSILLERDRLVAEADRMNLCITAVRAEPTPADGGDPA